MNERDLYPAVKTWFRQERRCASAFADLPDESELWVVRHGRRYEIDVWAVEDQPGAERRLIHVAEGTLIATGHSIDDCLSQTESFRAFGDFLWVFFPQDQWDALPPKDRADHEERVRARGMGLLLVDGTRCRQRFAAPPNPYRDDKEIRAILDELGHADEEVVPYALVLSREDARTAAAMMVVATMAERAARRALKTLESGAGHWQVSDDRASLQHGAFIRWVQKDRLIIEVDPFGSYRKDGRPVLWVWRLLGQTDVAPAVRTANPVITHWFFSNGDLKWLAAPIRAVTPARVQVLLAAGYGYDVRFGRRIDLLGRTLAAIEHEIATTVKTVDD